MRKRIPKQPKGGPEASKADVVHDKLQLQKEKDKPKGRAEKAVKKRAEKTGLWRSCFTWLKYLILLLLVPPFLNFAALTREGRVLQPPGALYDIGFGQKLYLGCVGEGEPTVILDAPTGRSSDVWYLVQTELAKFTKVCVYDRAGLGFSERPYYNRTEEGGDDWSGNTRNRWQHFTVERMADDLHRLVNSASQQQKPFILVGSELGAIVARVYTQIYESDVSDLVLIDPLVEGIFEQDGGVWNQFWLSHLVPSFQTMQFSAAIGLTRLSLLLGLIQPPLSGQDIPDDVQTRQKYLMCNPRHLSSVVDEHHFINLTFSQMATVMRLKPFPSNVSITFINGNYYDEQLPSPLNKAWAKSQQELINRLHPSSNHIVVNGADHRMLYRKPQAVVDPIRRLIKHRRHKPLRTKTM